MDRDLICIGELLTFDTPGFYGALPPSRMDEAIIIKGAYLSIRNGKISAYGSMSDYQASDGVESVDLSNKTVLPGFVDPHTHLVFAGSREHELVERIESVRNISKGERMSGGIKYTVEQTSQATRTDLLKQALKRMDQMLAHGTTMAEAKSGYGLALEHEIKLLEVIQQANAQHPVDLAATFLGAHALPGDRHMAEYVAEVLHMIPEIARRGLAEFCDVFCEEGFFSVADSRRILELAKKQGMRLKVHADELAASGGARLAAELGAVSADHLQYASREDFLLMKESGTIPVLLPGVSFYLGIPYVDANVLRDLDLPIALATDLNPGGCYCESQLFIMLLAVHQMKLLPLEALAGITRNAAHAMARGGIAGVIAIHRDADLVVLDAPNHDYLAYHFGVNLVSQVYKTGELVFDVQKKGAKKSAVKKTKAKEIIAA